ncbi:hypothetical protein QFC20_000405 [Naganishia adeliensis]|uniref:Uncharacterized protein n=1 Tax=Naganishia adeliensis TaxID=92952 RepID=A0ACC2X107_9TREE|nr:hypothetical protein QFC20_000405 [Naganishia adeliensis]
MKEDIPTTQRAWKQFSRGKPKDVLRLVADAPVPIPAPGEVLVKVHSVALNPLGYKLMGSVPWPIARYPIVAENDFAGTIVDANGHTDWHVGQAAGLPIAGMTAYEGIVKRAKVHAGQRVFINGGSNAVGSIAIQIAKQRGATVVTCCSAAKLEFVLGLGADVVLDYTIDPLVSQLAKLDPFDVVMDCIGTISLYRGSTQFLKPKCPYIAVGIDMNGLSTWQTVKTVLQLARAVTPSYLGSVPRKFEIFYMVWDEKALKELADMVNRDEIHVPIDGEYGWEKGDVMKAYDRQMSARARGKIIIQMQQRGLKHA